MKFKVSGICFVPTEAEVIVEADDDVQALKKAKAMWREDRTSLIINNSGDEGAAFNWEPTVEPLDY